MKSEEWVDGVIVESWVERGVGLIENDFSSPPTNTEKNDETKKKINESHNHTLFLSMSHSHAATVAAAASCLTPPTNPGAAATTLPAHSRPDSVAPSIESM